MITRGKNRRNLLNTQRNPFRYLLTKCGNLLERKKWSRNDLSLNLHLSMSLYWRREICLWIFICSWNLAMNSSALRSISFSSSGILSLYSSSSTPFKKLLHPPSSHSYSSSSKSTCGVVQGMLNRTGRCILTWKIGVLSKKSWRSPWWSWVRVVWPWARLLRNWGKTRSSTIKRLLKTPPFLAHKQCYTQDVPCSMIFSCHCCIWVVEKSKSWEFVWVVLRFSRGAC